LRHDHTSYRWRWCLGHWRSLNRLWHWGNRRCRRGGRLGVLIGYKDRRTRGSGRDWRYPRGSRGGCCRLHAQACRASRACAADDWSGRRAARNRRSGRLRARTAWRRAGQGTRTLYNWRRDDTRTLIRQRNHASRGGRSSGRLAACRETSRHCTGRARRSGLGWALRLRSSVRLDDRRRRGRYAGLGRWTGLGCLDRPRTDRPRTNRPCADRLGCRQWRCGRRCGSTRANRGQRIIIR
jgi:hypothetical protein